MKRLAFALLFPIGAYAQVQVYSDNQGRELMYSIQVDNNTFYSSPSGQDIGSASSSNGVTTYFDNQGRSIGYSVAPQQSQPPKLEPPQPPRPPEPPVYKP